MRSGGVVFSQKSKIFSNAVPYIGLRTIHGAAWKYHLRYVGKRTSHNSEFERSHAVPRKSVDVLLADRDRLWKLRETPACWATKRGVLHGEPPLSCTSVLVRCSQWCTALVCAPWPALACQAKVRIYRTLKRWFKSSSEKAFLANHYVTELRS
jgi:hypothetical protein